LIKLLVRVVKLLKNYIINNFKILGINQGIQTGTDLHNYKKIKKILEEVLGFHPCLIYAHEPPSTAAALAVTTSNTRWAFRSPSAVQAASSGPGTCSICTGNILKDPPLDYEAFQNNSYALVAKKDHYCFRTPVFRSG
jgi:hypothetical protein